MVWRIAGLFFLTKRIAGLVSLLRSFSFYFPPIDHLHCSVTKIEKLGVAEPECGGTVSDGSSSIVTKRRKEKEK